MSINKKIIVGTIATVLGSGTVGVEAKMMKTGTTNGNLEIDEDDNRESAESLLQLRKMYNGKCWRVGDEPRQTFG